jgi:hypothetical protein
MSKKSVIFFVAISLLVALGFYRNILDSLYFSWNHKSYEKFLVLDEVTSHQFDAAPGRTGGSLSMEKVGTNEVDWGVSYASYYDNKTNAFFYRFQNMGPDTLTIGFSPLAPLFGQSCLTLKGKEVVYFKIVDRGNPTRANDLLRIVGGCAALGTLRVGNVIGAELVVPE